MIYLVVFVYLLCLSIHYDILGKKGHKRTHYKVAVILLALVAGLRWRVGSDTVMYAADFNLSHDLFHLEWSDFESPMKMPLWVLLNAACKTVWDDFVLVQLVVAALGIGMTCYFIRKVCPSLCFYVLLCYVIGWFYFVNHFELLRESIAIAFFWLGILGANDGKPKKVMLCFLLAVLSHVFSAAAVLLFAVCYYLLPRRPLLYWTCCVAVVLVTLLDNDFLTSWIGNYLAAFSGSDTEIINRVIAYTGNDAYGNPQKMVIQFVWLVVQVAVYVFMFYKIRPLYSRFIRLRQDLFAVCVFLSILFLTTKYSFGILFRMADYFYIFTLFLALVFAKGVLIDKIRQRQRVFMYCILLSFPLFFGGKAYLFYKDNFGMRSKSRYFPYSSVFDRTIAPERETEHQIRGGGYSRDNDYGLVFRRPARRGK